MRISFEGNATEAVRKSRDNCLKALKKMSFKILQKAVDRQAIHCRMHASKQAVSRLLFRRFSETETTKNKRLTRWRNDVEYAALIEQQLKRSLKS
ncbi:hypothetical protein KO499_19685 [Marinobacter sp. F3R08]|nr:hypothetical protein [Marinobacter sp. F3R08]